MTRRAHMEPRAFTLPSGQAVPVLGIGREGVANGARRAVLSVSSPAGVASTTARLYGAATLGGPMALLNTVVVPPLETGLATSDVACAEYAADAQQPGVGDLVVTVSFNAED